MGKWKQVAKILLMVNLELNISPGIIKADYYGRHFGWEHIASISSLEKWMSPHPIRTEKGSHDVKWPSKGLEREKQNQLILIQT